jgi:hypothetical protein
MDAAGYSKRMANMYQSTGYRNPEAPKSDLITEYLPVPEMYSCSSSLNMSRNYKIKIVK